MADWNTILQRNLQEFIQMWSHGYRAHLQVQCSQGRAWVNLSTDLGPWRFFPPNFHQNPRPRRPKTTPTPSPKPPGKPTPPSKEPPPPPPSSPSPSQSMAPPTVSPSLSPSSAPPTVNPPRTPTPTQPKPRNKRKWANAHTTTLVEALLLDEACGEVEPRFSQVDGQSDSPVSQGKEVEVKTSELKEMEGPMKGWSQVRGESVARWRNK